MRISTRLRLAVYVPALMALVIAIALFFSYQDMARTQETGDTVRQIRSGITELNHIVFAYTHYHEERPKQQFLAGHEILTGLIGRAEVDTPDEQRLLDSIRDNNETMEDLFLQLVANYEQGGGDAQGTQDRLVGLLLLRSYEADTAASTLRNLVDDGIRDTQIRTVGLILVVLVLAAIPLSVVLSRTRRHVVSSLSELSKGTAVIGSGNLDYRIEQRTNDEIGDLSRAFNRMTADLKTITASKTDLEIEVAARKEAEEELKATNENLQEQTIKLEEEVEVRKKAQEALRKSEEKYRNLFSSMGEGFALHEIILDAGGKPCDYRFLELNDAFEKLTGISREQAVGRTVKEVIPNIEPYWIEKYGQVALSGEPTSFEDYSAPLDRWYGVYAYSPAKNQFAVLFGDITDRKKAEEALKASEEKFRIVADFTYDWEYWRSQDNKFIYMTPSCLRFTGYTAREFIDDPDLYLSIVHPDDRERVAEHMNSGLHHADFEELEFRIVRRDGEERWIGHLCQPVLDDRGNILGRRSSNRDITENKHAAEEIKRSNAELEASNRELEAFAYSVSHDLRAPLRSMEGFSNALLEDYAEKLDEQGKKYLRYVQESSDLMGKLIDDLLKLSRVTRSEMNYEVVDLSELAQNLISRLGEGEPRRKGTVEIKPDIFAYGDRNLLRLVLENLLGNAWKFSSKVKSPRIEIGITEHNGRRAYFVRDNGVGFNMAYADKLFKPFQRLHKETEFGGTGIGLATVYRIIRRHGGDIWADSKAGEGTTFYFTLS